MEDIVIVAATRTAVGKFGGTLAKTPATDLGAAVIKNLLARTKLGADQIGEVILGQVLAAGVGQNPARQSLIKSGLAKETPALTINAWAAVHGRYVNLYIAARCGLRINCRKPVIEPVSEAGNMILGNIFKEDVLL